jgi:hypothetical protein
MTRPRRANRTPLRLGPSLRKSRESGVSQFGTATRPSPANLRGTAIAV